MAQGARQRKDLATARQERREAASSESRRGRAGIGAPAPTPEERRTERASGAARPGRHRRRRSADNGMVPRIAPHTHPAPRHLLPVEDEERRGPMGVSDGGGGGGGGGQAVSGSGGGGGGGGSSALGLLSPLRMVSAEMGDAWKSMGRRHPVPQSHVQAHGARPGLTSSLCAIRRGPGCSAALCPRCL